MRLANRHPSIRAANMYLTMWASLVLLGIWVAKMHPGVWIPNLHPRRLRRFYRRFKYRKQYDSPLLIMFCEVAVGVTPVALLAVSSFFAYQYFF